MDDELVLLTSYFNLAGGRRQDTADTFRVDPSLASATSPDGTAALYIITESSGGSHMGNRARRLAVDTVAWEYASHGDLQPATRLKAALQAAHESVLGEYEGHVSIGMSVLAVEADTVYLGQVAPAQVYVVHDGGLHSISAHVEGTSPFARALGSTAGPQITVFRDQIGPDDVVAVCTSWFHQGADPADLRECFGAGSADDIAECLLELAKQHSVRDTTVIVIEAALGRDLQEASDEDEPVSFMEQVDTAVQALASVGRMLWSELRSQPADSNGRRDGAAIPDLEPAAAREARVPATEPSSGASTAGAYPAADENGTSPPVHEEASDRQTAPGRDPDQTVRLERPAGTATRVVGDQATEEVPILPADEAPPYESMVYAEPATDREEREGTLPRDGAPSYRTPTPGPDPVSVSEIDRVNQRIQNAPDLGDVIPPVQAFPDTSTEPSRIYATSKDIQAVNKRPRRFAGIARPVVKDEASAPVIRPGMSDIDLRRPISRPTPPAVIWLSIVAVILLAAGSVWLYFNHRHTAVPVKPYATYAKRDIALASRQSTPAQQDVYLAAARRNIALAKKHGTPAWRIAQLRQSLLATSDTLHHISREAAPSVLADFSKLPNAQPAQVAAAPGLVFVLDTGRHSVFSIVPNPVSGPNEIVRAGEVDNGYTLNNPQQLAASGTTALVLDDHNVLVRSTDGAKTATSLLQPSQTPAKVVALGSSAPDVYVLDTANNELWRYPNAITYFNPAPSAFFTPNTPGTPTLNNAVSFAFDDKFLYILRSDGSLLKFDILQANPQKFAAPDSVLRHPLQNPPQLYTAPGLNYVWVADPANGRIIQLDKSGTFVRSYVSGSAGMDLHQMKGLAVAPTGREIYVLAGAKLFGFPAVP